MMHCLLACRMARQHSTLHAGKESWTRFKRGLLRGWTSMLTSARCVLLSHTLTCVCLMIVTLQAVLGSAEQIRMQGACVDMLCIAAHTAWVHVWSSCVCSSATCRLLHALAAASSVCCLCHYIVEQTHMIFLTHIGTCAQPCAAMHAFTWGHDPEACQTALRRLGE